MMEHESKDLLEKYGIKTARCIFVQDEDKAIKAAKSVGFPAYPIPERAIRMLKHMLTFV